MEYAEEGDLLQYKRKQKQGFSETEIKDIFKETAEAIEELWRNNMIHRDIKPANLLIFKTKEPNNHYQEEEEGEEPEQGEGELKLHVKLCDFGNSFVLSPSVCPKTYIGNERYLSPEVVNL